MRVGSLFSGVGGLDLAVEAAFDATAAWHVEFDAAPSKVLAAVDWAAVEPVDIIALADSTTSTVAHRQAEGALYGRVVTHVGIEQPLRPDIAAALGIEAVDHD